MIFVVFRSFLSPTSSDFTSSEHLSLRSWLMDAFFSLSWFIRSLKELEHVVTSASAISVCSVCSVRHNILYKTFLIIYKHKLGTDFSNCSCLYLIISHLCYLTAIRHLLSNFKTVLKKKIFNSTATPGI